MEDSRHDLRTEHNARRTRKSKCRMQISKCRMPRSGVCQEERSKEESIFAKTGVMWPLSTEARRSRDGRRLTAHGLRLRRARAGLSEAMNSSFLAWKDRSAATDSRLRA
jgi:hypothetical protein